jgi:thioredoxin-like negative regulator of GroEL
VFFSRNRTWLSVTFLAAPLLLLLVSCSRERQSAGGTPVKRIGVLTFENLSSDASLDWMGRAVSTVISSQLSGQRSLMPLDLQNIRDADTARVTELVQGYYTTEGDRLRLTAQVRNPNALKDAKTLSVAGARSGGLLPLVDQLARQIDSGAHPYSTRNEQAAKQLFEGMSASRPEEALPHISDALKADPAFGPAYLAKTQLLLSRNDAAGAKAVLEEAAKNSKQFPEADQAKLAVLSSTLSGSAEERTAALSRLTAALPADLPAWEALANLQIVNKNFPAAAKTLRSALQLEPESVPLVNSLAYVLAFAGDFDGALNAVATYRKLAPDDANAIDTLAEISFVAGRFADAERYFVEANQRNKALVNGAELYRAAVAAFLAGNRKAADEHYKSYVEALKAADDQLIPIRNAIWAYQTGNPSAAEQLKNYAAGKETPAEAASIAHSQLALWWMESGQPDRAREDAAQGLKLATSAKARTFAAITSFLVSPKASASEWKLRTERAAPGQAAIQRQALGYALLLSKQYSDAIPALKAIYDTGGLDAMGEPKVFLAYAYLQAGQTQEAVKLVKSGMLPPKSLDPGVPSLLVSDYAFLKSRVK